MHYNDSTSILRSRFGQHFGPNYSQSIDLVVFLPISKVYQFGVFSRLLSDLARLKLDKTTLQN